MVHPENDSFQSRNLLLQGNFTNQNLPAQRFFSRVKFPPPKQKCGTPTFIWNFIALILGDEKLFPFHW